MRGDLGVSMPKGLNKVPKAGGEVDLGWYGSRKCSKIRERVTVSVNDRFATLSQQLPGRSRLVWGLIRSNAALNLNAWTNASATNSAAAMAVVAVAGIAPTALATNATTSHAVLGPAAATATGTVPVGTVAAGAEAGGYNVGGLGVLNNTSTSPITVYLVPYAAVTAGSATHKFSVGTGTAATVATTGYYFASTGELDVQCWVEEYESDPAS